MIEIKNLYHSLGTKSVLENVNITVKESTITGLVGINGAGKTTLLRLISGIYTPDKGTIFYKGYPVDRPDCRNFLIRVTDPELLEKTGGIVQGMSGSPIIQNGKLIGAVTHVLVNSPDTGYGIFIENMLNAAE